MTNFPQYECYVKCSLAECEKRDPKGLYKRARSGEITNLTGIGSPYGEPSNSDLIIDTDCLDLNASVSRVVEFLNNRDLILSYKLLTKESLVG